MKLVNEIAISYIRR